MASLSFAAEVATASTRVLFATSASIASTEVTKTTNSVRQQQFKKKTVYKTLLARNYFCFRFAMYWLSVLFWNVSSSATSS